MLRKRQPREPYAHDLRQFARSARNEIKRHRHAVVEPFVAFAQSPRRKAGLFRRGLKLAHELCVVGCVESFLRRAELREITRRSSTRRNVEIIRVHRRVRRDDDQSLRCETHDESRRPLVSANRRRDHALFAAPHRRNDERRVRNHYPRRYSHCVIPPIMPIQSLCPSGLYTSSYARASCRHVCYIIEKD